MKNFKIVIFYLSLLLNMYFLAIYWVVYRGGEISNKNLEDIQKYNLNCSEGSVVNIERWGKNGYSKSCIGATNGRWIAWENGYKNIEGEYLEGKENGKWIWFHKNGAVYREVTYDHGNETKNIIINEQPQ